jgi:GH24 family phage-related lysozyme (muramidase)
MRFLPKKFMSFVYFLVNTYMNEFDNTINMILLEDWKSMATAGMLGLGALAGGSTNADASNIDRPSIEKTSEIPWIYEAYNYIGDNEGNKLHIYKDSKGYPTIGVGHRILKGEDFSGGITEEESFELFKEDVKKHYNIAKRLFPKIETYPTYLKIALLDGVFRGDHKSKYKTTKLINSGNFIEASKEHLRNNDYYESKAKGDKHGVWKRMQKNADAMYLYGWRTQRK